MKPFYSMPLVTALVAATSFWAISLPVQAQVDYSRFVYADVIRVINNGGAAGKLAPQVRITSPSNEAHVARGFTRSTGSNVV